MAQICASPHERDAGLTPNEPRQAGGNRSNYVGDVMSSEINSRQRYEQNNYAGTKEAEGTPAQRYKTAADECGQQTVEESPSHGVPARKIFARQNGSRIWRERQ